MGVKIAYHPASSRGVKMSFIKSSSQLEIIKWMAILSMIADHVGIVFYPTEEIFRFLGRFAFIGFAFILAYNYRYHTHNKNNYKLRLFIWALISQIPYYLVLGDYTTLNILFLLLAGLYAIDAVELMKQKSYTHLIFGSFIFSVCIISTFYTGYYIFGVLLVVLFYNIHDHKALIYPLIACIALVNFSYLYAVAGLISLAYIYTLGSYQNESLGKISIKKINKHIYYAFYPLHLLVILFVYMW